MPIGSFRRPELQAAAHIDFQVKQIPIRYAKNIMGSNSAEKYMSLMLGSGEVGGTSVSEIKSMLKRYPFEFDFRDLSIKEKSDIIQISKHFNYSDILRFFRVTKYSLTTGINSLARLIEAKESTISELESLDLEVEEIRKSREQFARGFAEKHVIEEFDLEQIYYIFGPTSEFELSELFFEFPSSFVSESYCSKCERGITNWISVILGEGPICGEHNYEIVNLGKSFKEITDHVIDLVERKHSLLASGPVSIRSPLVKFRKARLDYGLGGTSIAAKEHYFAQRPFLKSSIMRDIQISDYPNDYWREYIHRRVALEYLPLQKKRELNFESGD